MHALGSMTATHLPQLHDHAGIRWLAPMMAGLVVVVIGILLMLVYPYVSP
jgi:hypothetical protein